MQTTSIGGTRRYEMGLEEAQRLGARTTHGRPLPKSVGGLERAKTILIRRHPHPYNLCRAGYGRVAVWRTSPLTVGLYWLGG